MGLEPLADIIGRVDLGDILLNSISVLALASMVMLPLGASAAIAYAIRVIPRNTPAHVCRRCLYDRRGLGPDRACPECGLRPIEALKAAPLHPKRCAYWTAATPMAAPVVFVFTVLLGNAPLVMVTVLVIVLACAGVIAGQLARVRAYVHPDDWRLLTRVPTVLTALTLGVGALAYMADPAIPWRSIDLVFPIAAGGCILGSATLGVVLTLFGVSRSPRAARP